MNPNTKTHEQRMAEMAAKLMEQMQNRKVRTVKGAIERDREELIAMRLRGMTIYQVATAYQELLHSEGILCNFVYLEKMISQATKDAAGRPSARRRTNASNWEQSTAADVGGLIPVFRAEIGGVEVDAVNARDLHAFLEVGKDFSNWIKDRIRKYEFVENQDFILDSPILANQNSWGGDRRSKDYHLTLDMAKELSMVENNEKGRIARRYFIEIERRYYSGEAYRPVPVSESLPEPEEPAESLASSLDSCPDGRGLSSTAPSGDSRESPFAADNREILHDFPNLLDALLPESVSTESFLRSAQAFYRAQLLLNPDLPHEDVIRQAFARAAELCGADLKRIAEAIAGPCKKRWF